MVKSTFLKKLFLSFWRQDSFPPHPSSLITPIINPPQAAILAVGGMKDKPLVRGGKVVAAPVVSLTLVGDHRVLDGAVVTNFLKSLKELFENPTISNPETK